jgi:hypothetical protein
MKSRHAVHCLNATIMENPTVNIPVPPTKLPQYLSLEDIKQTLGLITNVDFKLF